jgi:phage antirepressor YoqD-like protein
MSNQDVMLIRHVAKALRVCPHHLIAYLLQCAFSEMNGRGSA